MANEEKKESTEAKAELTPEEAAAKSRKKKLIIIITAGLLVTAGTGGGLAFFLSRGGEPEMAAKSAPATDAHSTPDPSKEAEKTAAADKGAGHGSGSGTGSGSAAEATKPGDPAKQGAAVAKLDNVDFGCTTSLKPFHLNLGNPLENRYIRLEVSLEHGCSEELKQELERRLPQLRDSVITVTSRKTREFLLGPDGKEQLRKEIHNKVNHYMTKKVDDVFITDILIE